MKTIKQQHLKVIRSSEYQHPSHNSWLVDQDEAAEKCSAITEDVAIEFAVWLYANIAKCNKYNAKELLEQFKKQNGL